MGTTAARRRLPVSIIVAVAVVIMADVMLRLASPALPTQNEWNDWEATNKAAAIEALDHRGGASVVLVGSSMMNAAADPARLTQLLGADRPVFNAALNGAGAALMDFWTLRETLPRLRPRIVVIGLSSRELNDAGIASTHAFDAVRHSQAGRRIAADPSVRERIYAFGDKVSALVRYREVLRNPSRLYREDVQQQRSAVDALGRLRGLRIFAEAPYVISDRFRDTVVPRSLGGFTIGGRDTRALRHLLDELARARVRVVLVEMPITDDAIRFHPKGTADYTRFADGLQRIAASDTNVTFLRAIDSFPSHDDYFDPFHLNGRGRDRFTRLLAEALRTGTRLT